MEKQSIQQKQKKQTEQKLEIFRKSNLNHKRNYYQLKIKGRIQKLKSLKLAQLKIFDGEQQQCSQTSEQSIKEEYSNDQLQQKF
ncbi:unnamed protein product (macronuclear) [Paramecium tetraurelia]|uniref:Uncharacterized protein n=1 Tax=Paramecium tetraurelia TaxID=5888 RepID=A0BSL6_PARTE|nr:uncharacterized protein GSPATT00031765001 [Paramecium tetraurelia]CAK61533.1 unnamed protein product [Paramecium tetraurelia]|eukprot:XP_001428931.1 hypothetical protein (macronuclear) [Paramecium tetraurelia strain d4-2]